MSLAEFLPIRRAAMDLLARREHSEKELHRKLSRKGFASDLISQAIQQLAKENLQSNRRFAENYIQSRREKGFGPLHIQQELLERGINKEEIAELLQTDDNAWLEALRKIYQKRFKHKMPVDYKERAHCMRFLLGRGFTSEQIEMILKA